MIDRDEVQLRMDMVKFYESELGTPFKYQGKEGKTNCPFHDDKTPSFYFNRDTGDWICRSGCGGGDFIKFYERKHGIDFKAAIVCLAEMAGVEEKTEQVEAKKTVSKIYKYTDAAGNYLYEKIRYVPKTFSIRDSQSNVWGFNGKPKILYNLPKVIQSGFIVICEGEKDADNVGNLGFTATTNIDGGGKWDDSYCEYLKAKHVVILPHNDEAGWKHEALVGSKLIGVASSVSTLRLKGLAVKGDVSDWIQARKDQGIEDQLIREELKQLMANAPLWEPPKEKSPRVVVYDAKGLIKNLRDKAHYYQTTDELPGCPTCGKFKEQIPYWMPSHMVVVAGYTNFGKSTLLSDILSRTREHKKRVIVFSLEEIAEAKCARFIGWESGISLKRIMTYEKFTPGWQKSFDDAAGKIGDWNPLIFDRVRTVEGMREIVEREKEAQGVDIVAIDYIQKIQGDPNIYARMSKAAADIFEMGIDLDVCTMVLSQVNNESVREGGVLLGLKGAGEIGEAADIIIRLDRKSKEKPDVDIYIEKNRPFGATKLIKSTFNSSYTKIDALTEVYANDGV